MKSIEEMLAELEAKRTPEDKAYQEELRRVFKTKDNKGLDIILTNHARMCTEFFTREIFLRSMDLYVDLYNEDIKKWYESESVTKIKENYLKVRIDAQQLLNYLFREKERQYNGANIPKEKKH